MRPVNLIPDDVKRRTDRRPTGVAPYILIGMLALVAGGAGVYVMIENRLTSKRDELGGLTAQVEETNRQADAVAEYGRFAELMRMRQAALITVAGARFPWDEVLFDISKALPRDAWLVRMKGKMSPNAKTGDKGESGGEGGGSSGSDGGDEEGIKDPDVPGPRITLEGCTYTQTDVAEMMADLRNISGAKQVMLTRSESLTGGTGGGGGATSTEECRTNNRMHRFVVVVTFAPGPGSALSEAVNGGSDTGAAAQPAGEKSGGSGSGGDSGEDGGTPESSPPPGGAGEPVSGVGP